MDRSDIEAWRRVEAEISKVAKDLCRRCCSDARLGSCRCDADQEPEWRREALKHIKREATTPVREPEPGEVKHL